jgi:hypothetical protein
MITGSFACAGDLVSDTSAELTEVAQRVTTTIFEPANTAILGGSAAATVSAIVNPHQTFQFLGIVGIELTLLRAALSYESPSALVRDWSYKAGQVSRNVSNALAGPLQLLQQERSQAVDADVSGATVAVQPESPVVTGEPEEPPGNGDSTSYSGDTVKREVPKPVVTELSATVDRVARAKSPNGNADKSASAKLPNGNGNTIGGSRDKVVEEEPKPDAKVKESRLN